MRVLKLLEGVTTIRIFVVACFLVLVFAGHPSSVMAHTGLQSSIPGEGEVVNGQMKDILMEFNTEVESLSRFKLTDEFGNEVAIEELTVDKNRMSGKLKENLAAGPYTIVWKIVGRDGHPIDGQINFIVESEADEAGAGATEDEEQTPAPTASETADKPADMEPTAETPDEAALPAADRTAGQSFNTMIGIWVIVALAAAAIISMAVRGRRKKP